MTRVLILGFAPLPWEDTRCTYGPGIRAWQFAQPLAQDGHDVCLLTQRLPGVYPEHVPPREERQVEGIHVHHLNPDVWADGRTTRRIIEEFGPDCIVTATIFSSGPACGLKQPPPLWIDMFGHVMAEAQAKAHRYQDDSYLAYFWGHERDAVLNGDMFSSVSDAQRYATIGELGALGRLNRHTTSYPFVHTIPCALEGQPYVPPPPAAPRVFRGSRVPADAFVVLWSGGYNTWTDVDTLFAGLELAMARQPDLHFVSTGGEIAGHDERTYPHFVSLVENSAFKDRFHLLGWIPRSQVPATYFEANIGINIDRFMYEGMLGSKNRVLDWMRAGLPALVGELCELSRLLPQQHIGYTYPLEDPAALSAQLLTLAADPVAVKATGQRALIYGLEHLSFTETTTPLRNWVRHPQHAPDRLAGRLLPLARDGAAGHGAAQPARSADTEHLNAAFEEQRRRLEQLEAYASHVEDELSLRDHMGLRALLGFNKRLVRDKIRRWRRGIPAPLARLPLDCPVDVILVGYKARDLLRQCLLSLRADRYEFKRVIVVDNNSADGTVEMLESEFPEAQLIRNSDNRGFAAACNQGMRAGSAPVKVLLNQDTEVDPGWLRWITRTLRADPLAGIAGCKIFYPDGKTIQHAGGIVRPNGLTGHVGDGLPDPGGDNEPRAVDYVTGAAMAIRTELLERLGMLDEGYQPAYYEELDLCVRARRKGFRVLYEPRATLRHHESTVSGKLSQRFLFLYHRNRLRFILKNSKPLGLLTGFIPFELGWLFKIRPRDQYRPLLKAYADNLRILPNTFISRFRPAPRM